MKKLMGVVMMILSIGSLSVSAAPYYLISDLGVSAQTIGLGRVEGLTNSASGVFENPAAINTDYMYSASFFTAQIMNEVNYLAFSGAQKFDFGTVGVGYMQASIGDIPLTADNGVRFIRVGTFDYLNYIAKVSYQYDYAEKISVGASMVNYSQRFHDVNSSGFNFDVGATYQMWDDLALSVFSRNIVPGLNVSYDDGSTEELQLELTGSARYTFEDFIYFAQLRFKGGHYLTSWALRYQPSFFSFIALNTGYYSDLVVEQIHSGYSLGLSLLLGSVEVHYAYEKSDYVGANNKSYVSLDVNF